MSRRWRQALPASVLAPALALASALAGCGSDPTDVRLLTRVEWNDRPGSTAEVGYWVSVHFGWPSRAQSCLPPWSTNIHVTVNGREASPIGRAGDCSWDMLLQVGPFAVDDRTPLTVRVLDGTSLIGEAVYEGLIPGYGARIVSPQDGKVPAGGEVTLALDSPLPAGSSFFEGATFMWLDAPAGIPPFYTYGNATLDSDRQTMKVVARAGRIGRAALAGITFGRDGSAAQICTGFQYCQAGPSRTIGPVFLEVVP